MENIFEEQKKFALEDVIEHYTGESLVNIGTDTYELESKTCPFKGCGHNDSFRVKLHEDEDSAPIAKCFSCDEWANDGAGFLACMLGISPSAAARRIITDALEPDTFEPRPPKIQSATSQHRQSCGITRPPDDLIRLFEAASEHYQMVLASSPAAMTYQTQVRRHSHETLTNHGVGLADDGLLSSLRKGGFSLAKIVNSGLVRPTGMDLFRAGSYVYVHRNAAGQACHFTQKDPSKKALWQLPKAHQLLGITFYGEHTLPLGEVSRTVLLVEGENDLLSCVEAGWQSAILATTGCISYAQLAWIEQRMPDWTVISLMDLDEAGDKYRSKLSQLQLKHLTQYLLPFEYGKDPDEVLKTTGWSIDELFAHCKTALGNPVSLENIPAPSATARIAPPLLARDFPCTDRGNADLLCELSKGHLKYVTEHADWACFDGNSWCFHQEHKVYERCREVSAKRHMWAAAMPEQTEEERASKKQARSFAIGSENNARINYMINLAKKDARMIVSAAEFDSHPYLLGVRNGVVNLKSGELLPPNSELLLSKQCLGVYIATAQCPKWESMLKTALSHDDEAEHDALMNYLQKVLGMSLIGVVLERAFFFIHGKPGTGKSLTTNTILRVLGDYGKELSPNSLMQSSYQSNDIKMPEVVHLKGVRFALASEAEHGQRFNDGLLKRITGQDAIVARDLGEKAITFRPQATLFITGNVRPSAGGGNALWERLKVIGFNHQIPKSEQNPHLQDELLNEADGILTWLVAGCLKYQAEGLVEPESVRQESDAYRADMDITAQFLEERCDVEDTHREGSANLYQAYSQWIESTHGIKALGRNSFFERLTEAGFSRGKARIGCSQQHVFNGLKLKPGWDICS